MHYENIWKPIIGNDSLRCHTETNNKFDKNAVGVVHDNLISKKVVGHVPASISKLVGNPLRFLINHLILIFLFFVFGRVRY